MIETRWSEDQVLSRAPAFWRVWRIHCQIFLFIILAKIEGYVRGLKTMLAFMAHSNVQGHAPFLILFIAALVFPEFNILSRLKFALRIFPNFRLFISQG